MPNGQTGFQINQKLYPTLDALINGEAKELGLVAGCLGSKYSILFVDLKLAPGESIELFEGV